MIVLYTSGMNNQNDIQQLGQSFVNITLISCTSHESEIMFSIEQNIFKICSMIQNETTSIWTVDLQVLKMNETEHLTNLADYQMLS